MTRRASVITNRQPVQMPKISHCSESNEGFQESFVFLAPIDHCTGHRSAFSSIHTIHEKPQSRVVEESHSGRGTKHVILPVSGVRSHRNKRQNFRCVLRMSVGTTFKPVTDSCSSFSVSAVRGVNEDSGVFPRSSQTVHIRQAVLHTSSDNGIGVGTGIEVDPSPEKGHDGFNVFCGRAPMLAYGVRSSASRSHCVLLASECRSLRSAAKEPREGAMTLNHDSTSARCSLK